MMKISLFLDTNVLLDIVLERQEFLKEAKEIMRLRDNEKVNLYVSALSLSTCAYFAKKFGKNPHAVISILLKWFVVIDLKKAHFESSVLSKFKDFEDALQYFSAKEVKDIDYIITRNTPDFKQSLVPVLSPIDFLSTLK